jgi:hypothetical protein
VCRGELNNLLLLCFYVILCQFHHQGQIRPFTYHMRCGSIRGYHITPKKAQLFLCHPQCCIQAYTRKYCLHEGLPCFGSCRKPSRKKYLALKNIPPPPSPPFCGIYFCLSESGFATLFNSHPSFSRSNFSYVRMF